MLYGNRDRSNSHASRNSESSEDDEYLDGLRRMQESFTEEQLKQKTRDMEEKVEMDKKKEAAKYGDN